PAHSAPNFCFCCVPLLPRAPTSTLFPYTTLFRSWPSLQALQKTRKETLRKFYYAHNARRMDLVEKRLEAIAKIHAACIVSIVELDRKSTRLNSSHVEISYAVFCLKKKKQEQRTVI